MLAVHFGAGNIGRGFIAEVLHSNGYEICFIDVSQPLIDQLNEKRAYSIRLAQEEEETIEINNVYGLNSQTEESKVIETIAQADLVTVSVGVNILPLIAPVLAAGLKKRLEVGARPIDVIACENAIGATTALKGHIKDQVDDATIWEGILSNTGFPDAAVDRIVPNQSREGLDVMVEPFFEWVVHTEGLKIEKRLDGVSYVDELTPYIERKLYTVNTGHACIAYLGFVHEIDSIAEAVKNPTIRRELEGVLEETGRLLEVKYHFEREELKAYHQKIIGRFENSHLSDPVERVGRNPMRKLSANDRLIGPLVQLHERKINTQHLLKVTAAAFLFDVAQDEESVQIQRLIKERGLLETIAEVTSLSPDHPLAEEIERAVAELLNQ
ncbi:mannitol-1-phosphate 5-dehydrogenase [Alkalihalophilus lindianensis]|uniref:Mannitol-1-phosphate 5-dehydrogenase n=1 Tax=Alkalihalophilus lindianensis TaxID=1630542 RepID=A0ABU3X8G7_9BACI|nr:mannitol-1-phosphate 5-dehydrogenase [Alkalihalophilus lindianensis]MDV2684181.1 mannitol-1-phosphate 5-dehydrogenase [Alkalihalophilus lindianensis]